MRIKLSRVALAAALAIGAHTQAQAAEEEHAKHQQQVVKGMEMRDGMHHSAGSKALHDSMSKGMEKMHGMKMTGGTDQDFTTMMIHHHQQAIAMAKAELEHGVDPAVQKKAREIIAMSEKDISELKRLQKQKP